MGRITQYDGAEVRPALKLIAAGPRTEPNCDDAATRHHASVNGGLTKIEQGFEKYALARLCNLLDFHKGNRDKSALQALRDGYRSAEIEAAFATIEQTEDVIFRAELAAVRLAMAIGGGGC